MYIGSWDEVPVGALVVQNTYNEVYEVIKEGPFKKIKHIDWQVPTEKEITNQVRDLDFDPDCMYDQPWIRIK